MLVYVTLNIRYRQLNEIYENSKKLNCNQTSSWYSENIKEKHGKRECITC